MKSVGRLRPDNTILNRNGSITWIRASARWTSLTASVILDVLSGTGKNVFVVIVGNEATLQAAIVHSFIKSAASAETTKNDDDERETSSEGKRPPRRFAPRRLLPISLNIAILDQLTALVAFFFCTCADGDEEAPLRCVLFLLGVITSHLPIVLERTFVSLIHIVIGPFWCDWAIVVRLGHFGPFWCDWAILGHFGAIGSFWAVLVQFGHFGAIGPFWAILVRSGHFWAVLVQLGHLSAIGPFWAILARLGHFGPETGSFWAIVV